MNNFRPFLLFFLFLSTVLPAQEVVWPGDVNNNGVVNAADLLFLGPGVGQTGPARKTITLEWQAEALSNTSWQTSAVPGLDLAFADCNGDGAIDIIDVEAIKQNFGNTHNDGTGAIDVIPAGVPGESPSFGTTESVKVFPNTREIVIPVSLGDAAIAVENLRGLSFFIKMDPEAFDVSTASFEFDADGWLPTSEEEAISFDLATPSGRSAPGDLVVAYTRINNGTSSGSGLIGNIVVQTGFVVIGDVPDFRITIDSILLIDDTNTPIPVLGTEIILEASGFSDSTNVVESICQGDSYAFNNLLISDAGTYRDTLTNQYNLDSIIILDLAVEDTLQTILSRSICQGETFLFNGENRTVAGNYRDTLVGANGCNQYVILNLAVEDTIQSVLSKAICEGESFIFKQQSLTTSGSYRDTLVGANGCNQYIVLNLNVNPIVQTNISATICENDIYTFGSQQLNDAGQYEHTLIAANGCDSTINLDLVVLPTLTTALSETICNGSSLDFMGQTLTEAGVYSATLSGANGCDSVLVMSLTVAENPQTTVNQTICQNTSYAFGGQDLATAGVYMDTLQTSLGCDSFVVLNLAVSDRYETELNLIICEGGSMNFNGLNLDATGAYQDTFVAVNGCDSIVTLNLEVATEGFNQIQAEICHGGSMIFGGQELTQAGVYMDTLSTLKGCDSLVELTLSMLPAFESVTEQTICEGDTVSFYNFVLTTTNSYMVILTTEAGCDSMVIMNLVVEEGVETSIDSMICQGESMTFGGVVLTEEGTYFESLTSSTGCDSTVALNLTIGATGVGECMSVSIEETLLEAIEIYPNPVNQNLFINSPDVKMTHIRLINLTGQVLRQQSFDKNNAPTQTKIAMQDLMPGIYWILVQTEYGLRQEKIVKF